MINQLYLFLRYILVNIDISFIYTTSQQINLVHGKINFLYKKFGSHDFWFCSGLHAKSNKPFMTSFLFFLIFPGIVCCSSLLDSFEIIMIHKYYEKFKFCLFIALTRRYSIQLAFQIIYLLQHVKLGILSKHATDHQLYLKVKVNYANEKVSTK